MLGLIHQYKSHRSNVILPYPFTGYTVRLTLESHFNIKMKCCLIVYGYCLLISEQGHLHVLFIVWDKTFFTSYKTTSWFKVRLKCETWNISCFKFSSQISFRSLHMFCFLGEKPRKLVVYFVLNGLVMKLQIFKHWKQCFHFWKILTIYIYNI